MPRIQFHPQEGSSLTAERGRQPLPMINARPEDDDQPIRIKVIGVGGAGGNAVSRMVERLSAVDLIAINTDAQALNSNRAPIRLQIGQSLTQGRGTGADPDRGMYAAEEDKARIGELLKGSDVVFLTLGLGGGTGTGAGPFIARQARDSGAVVIGFVTLPFAHEGDFRNGIARAGLPLVRESVDTLIVVPNEKIFEVTEDDIPLPQAYDMIDEILYQGVSGISDLVTSVGVENLDAADLFSIMRNGGEGLIGVGRAKGDGRAENAARMTIENPFLRRDRLTGARNVLISISASSPGVREIQRIVSVINEALEPSSKTFTGTVIDDRLEGEMKVTLIATGLDDRGATPAPDKKVANRKNPTRPGKDSSLFDDYQDPVDDEEPARDKGEEPRDQD